MRESMGASRVSICFGAGPAAAGVREVYGLAVARRLTQQGLCGCLFTPTLQAVLLWQRYCVGQVL